MKEYKTMVVDSKGNLVFTPKVKDKKPKRKVVPVIKGTQRDLRK